MIELPLLAGWLVLGWALSRLSTRVVDWFVMTDELLYERLAISIVHDHSPLPHVHGVLVPNLNQLYPLLLATVYRHGLVPGSLHDAHLLNAFLMSSAAIPAFLLARRTTRSRALAYLIALGTVSVPWIVYSSFLLTEVVGYPAFLWAVLGIQATLVNPSRRSDALAVAGIVLAIFARTQFTVLVVVLPAALVAYEFAAARAAATGERGSLQRAVRTLLERHRLLAGVYGLLAIALVVLLALGHISSLLGTYADTVEGNLVPSGLGRSLLTHLAVLALSTAILPFLLGVGWLIASALRPEPGEQLAFTATALTTLCAIWLEVTVFDLRFGGGIVRDRYFFYVVPQSLIACTCALTAPSWARRLILVPTVLATAGFLLADLPTFGKLDVDTPVSDIDGVLRGSAQSLTDARLTLAGATLLLAALYLQLSRLLAWKHLSVAVAVAVAVALPLETGYAYATLFGHPGTSGRPLTLNQGGVFDWIDQIVGTAPQVTMIPYPYLPGDYQASLSYWWDVEFWNESVGTDAYLDGAFEGTPSTFPKRTLHFDPETGLANISPTRYVVQLESDSRFRLYGNVLLYNRGAFLIDTGQNWHAAWITRGLYDDGWTIPGVTAQVRVFPTPGQGDAVMGALTFRIQTLNAGHRVEIRTDAGEWDGSVPAESERVVTLPLCQPVRGFTAASVSALGQSAIYGDMRTINAFGSYRTAGVLIASISFSHGTDPCRPPTGSAAAP